MSQVQFSHNPLFCIDIIKTYKPDFTPRVAFIGDAANLLI